MLLSCSLNHRSRIYSGLLHLVRWFQVLQILIMERQTSKTIQIWIGIQLEFSAILLCIFLVAVIIGLLFIFNCVFLALFSIYSLSFRIWCDSMIAYIYTHTVWLTMPTRFSEQLTKTHFPNEEFLLITRNLNIRNKTVKCIKHLLLWNKMIATGLNLFNFFFFLFFLSVFVKKFSSIFSTFVLIVTSSILMWANHYRSAFC